MAANDCFKIFVYGSLRSGFKSEAYQYISRYFNLIGVAKTKGIVYHMDTYPAAKPTEMERYIFGELYEIKHTDEFSFAIAQLDDYEGLHPEAGEIQAYTREQATILCDEIVHTAWVYWYIGDTDGKTVVDSGDLLAHYLA